MINIVADKDIPFVEHFFRSCGNLVLMEGREFTRRSLQIADVLLVRSITKVDKNLLEGTQVKFVASPTTGLDHFDTEWLDAAGILWSVAPGCNAIAVVEYILCMIAGLQKKWFLNQKNLRAGVIGVGKVGSKVAETLEILGFDVILCDPLRAENEKNFISTPIEDFKNLDMITLHTPLTSSGAYPTYHMIEKSFLSRQKNNCVLINSSRGSVINFNDLKISGEQLIWCLDVWENEPNIDFTILDTALIATPHIAGYTMQSKYRGTEMIYQAALRNSIIPDLQVATVPYLKKTLVFNENKVDWRDVILQIYDPFITTQQMKEKIIENKGKAFDLLRKHFISQAERCELGYVEIESVTLDEKDRLLLQRLGLNVPLN